MATTVETPEEQKELQLVEKVELRFALAESDDKLSKLLETFFCPLLLKLLSPSNKVKEKTIKVCDHIQTRLSSNSVKLPVTKLLEQYKDHASFRLLALIDIRFLEKGLARMSDPGSILPNFISVYSKRQSNGLAEIFHMLLVALLDYRLPSRGSPDDGELRQTLGLNEDSAQYLSATFGKLLLLNVNRSGQAIHSPGLSTEEIAFFTVNSKAGVWGPGGLDLSKIKEKLLGLLGSGAFTDDEKFLPALFASGNTNSNVSSNGEALLKHMHTSSMLENSDVVKSLYRLYFDLPPGATPELKIRILKCLGRSEQSAQFPQECIRIVAEALIPSATESSAASNPGTSITAGRSQVRLRKEAFTFINFMLRISGVEKTKNISKSVAPIVREFISHQGWPKAEEGSDLALRAQAYELVGRVVKSSQEVDMTTLIWLFKSLQEDRTGSEITLSIEEALSSFIELYSLESSSEAHGELAKLLLFSMVTRYTEENMAIQRRMKHVVVRFTNRCLPFSNVTGRWINILAVSGRAEDVEIAAEGSKGLDPWAFRHINNDRPWLWRNPNASVTSGDETLFPKLEEIIKTTFMADEDALMVGMEPESTSKEQQLNILHQSITRFSTKHPKALGPVAEFCFLLLIQQALYGTELVPVDSSGWAIALTTALQHDVKARRCAKAYMEKNGLAVSEQFLSLILASLQTTSISQYSGLFVQMLQIHPGPLDSISPMSSLSDELLPLLSVADPVVRHHAARTVGILFALKYVTTAGYDSSTVADYLSSMSGLSTTAGPNTIPLDGCLRMLAYTFSRTRLFDGAIPNDMDGVLLKQCLDTCKTFEPASVSTTVVHATFVMMEQYGKHIGFESVCDSTNIDTDSTLKTFIDVLMKWAKKGDETAIRTLGRISVRLEEDSSGVEYLNKELYSLHELRQPEAQFTIGESFACLAASWDCSVLETEADLMLKLPSAPIRQTLLESIVKRTMKDCTASKPSLRRASVIWLLSLLNSCGHLPVLQNNLRQCQGAFKSCLGDRDQLVQEAAARGLAQVYTQADGNLRGEVVKDLVHSFTDKQKPSGHVSGETQLFEAGTMSTGDGSISTYKDVMSLASELGNPDIVYKLMMLASEDAIWSSRVAIGRFGLTSVFSDKSMSDYLIQNPKVYAKLFRYRFDPSPGVRRSMSAVWDAVVGKDNLKDVLTTQFDVIMPDLLQNMVSKEWRARESCCGALADLISNRSFEDKYIVHIDVLWRNCFKLLDDIKSSVTIAAAKLAQVLINILINSLEAGESSAKLSNKMMEPVITFLRSYGGIGAPSELVQQISISTLIQITKKGGKVLRPYLSDLVDILIPLLDKHEGGADYIRMNAANYNMSEQDVDDKRLFSVRSSPIMEAIERCLDLLEVDSIKEVVTTLRNSISSAVSFSVKVGCSRILVSMATTRRELFKPYAGSLLKLLEKAAIDRNDSVASAYAMASGYLARLASDNQILRLINFSQTLYTTADNERHRALAGDFVHAVSKHASDRFNKLTASILPFVFIGKHDDADNVRSIFDSIWNEHATGHRAINLYLVEIEKLVETLLECPHWNIQHAAARALADAAEVLAKSIDGISERNAMILWPGMQKIIQGKTWAGKEICIDAFALFVTETPSIWRSESVEKETCKIMLREARRENADYQVHALRALGDVAAVLTQVDLLDDILAIVEKVLDKCLVKDDDDDMDMDDQTTKLSDGLRDRLLGSAIGALQSSLRSSIIEDRGSITAALTFSTICKRATEVRSASVSSFSFENMSKFFAKNDFADDKDDGDSTAGQAKDNILAVLFQKSNSSFSEAVNLKRAAAIAAITNTQWTLLKESLKPRLKENIESEQVMAIRDKLKDAYRALD